MPIYDGELSGASQRLVPGEYDAFIITPEGDDVHGTAIIKLGGTAFIPTI